MKNETKTECARRTFVIFAPPSMSPSRYRKIWTADGEPPHRPIVRSTAILRKPKKRVGKSPKWL
jgi:hypothetical protein